MKTLDERRRRILKQAFFTERAFGAEEIPAQLWSKYLDERSSQIEVTGGIEASQEQMDWGELEKSALSCTRCRLSEGRTHVVFGEGNPKADLMFVGEAPGFDEDREGRPFVGQAGKLLTRMIEAMGLRREDVYIANCLKCRPPQNRDPFLDEIGSCQPYLLRQIELIQPKVIVALGKFTAQTLLISELSISRLRGRFHAFRGMKLMPTYHPAYLLRNPQDKRLVWEDLKKVMAALKGDSPNLGLSQIGTPVGPA